MEANQPAPATGSQETLAQPPAEILVEDLLAQPVSVESIIVAQPAPVATGSVLDPPNSVEDGKGVAVEPQKSGETSKKEGLSELPKPAPADEQDKGLQFADPQKAAEEGKTAAIQTQGSGDTLEPPVAKTVHSAAGSESVLQLAKTAETIAQPLPTPNVDSQPKILENPATAPSANPSRIEPAVKPAEALKLDAKIAEPPASPAAASVNSIVFAAPAREIAETPKGEPSDPAYATPLP